jgi:hypothetical protein
MLTTEWLRRFGLAVNAFAGNDAAAEPDLADVLVLNHAVADVVDTQQARRATAYVARRGCGKTTVRRMFEMACEGTDILVVPILQDTWQTLTDEAQGRLPPGMDRYLHALVRAWLIALTAEHSAALQRPLAAGTESAGYLRHLIRRAKLRPAQRQQLLHFLDATPAPANPDDYDLAGVAPREQLLVLDQIVADLGFSRWCILIDDLEHVAPDSAAAAALVRPLINLQGATARLSVKYFCDPTTIAALQQMQNWPDTITVIPIDWSPDELEQLIRQRLGYYSDRRLVNLNYFSAESLPFDLTHHLIAHADGSPRRLVQLIKALFDERALDATDDALKIGPEHVERVLTKVAQSGAAAQTFPQPSAWAQTPPDAILKHHELLELGNLLVTICDLYAHRDVGLLMVGLPTHLHISLPITKAPRPDVFALLDTCLKYPFRPGDAHPLEIVLQNAQNLAQDGLIVNNEVASFAQLVRERIAALTP